jgi:hypothetical protein
MGDTRNAYNILVGNPEEKRPLEIQNDVDGKIILKFILKIVREDVGWVHLAQNGAQ